MSHKRLEQIRPLIQLTFEPERVDVVSFRGDALGSVIGQASPYTVLIADRDPLIVHGTFADAVDLVIASTVSA